MRFLFLKYLSICRFFDKISRTKEADEKVAQIKQHAINSIDNATRVAKTTADRQAKIMEKTTTYYIGKAMGSIK